ncbi:hypothetical protein V5799_023198 [Amblyomma americanum]|uniref:SAND domain-containing protein n=2 Tax=Amblyomma americanum TaxID=6943 RepID=A0AAQ4FIZ0_AMBAM
MSTMYREGEVILEVECGGNKGLLYLSRLCQGSKGPCILFRDTWLTPNEFQYVSGRETAKDWKRSIRHHGKSMKLLLAKGVLSVHPPVCDCSGCRIGSPLCTPFEGVYERFKGGHGHHKNVSPEALRDTFLTPLRA